MELLKSSSKFSKKQIILLSIPVFFSNMAIPLVGMVDTGLMGNLSETKYLAATSIATSVMTMIVWSFGFLRMGTVGIVAQAYGRSDYREIVKTILRNIAIALIAAFIIIIFFPALKIAISYFFSPSDETEVLIKTYLNVRIFSIPAELTIYVLVGFYLGIQKTKISSFLNASNNFSPPLDTNIGSESIKNSVPINTCCPGLSHTFPLISLTLPARIKPWAF